MNYINEDAFFAWYKSRKLPPLADRGNLLNDVFSSFRATGTPEYTIPAAESVTGRDETYEYRFENIGCCGASTLFIYF